jgi:hypothetical protein
MIKDPVLVNVLLDNEDYLLLIESLKNYKSFEYSDRRGRYWIESKNLPILKELLDKLLPKARTIFNSKTLIPSYAYFVHYEGQDPEPNLNKHKDDNACTYTFDMCVYQNEPWDFWVEDKSYTLYPNQALAYNGNEQMHWREKFPNPETNYVAMLFFHYAEPDHWYFTKGPEYLDVVRNKITEDEWNNRFFQK